MAGSLVQNDPSLYRIVYDSVVLLPFGAEGEQGLCNIVAMASLRNPGLGITGVLYCDGAYFIQILEGPRAAVEALMAAILRDPRHTDINIVAHGPHPRRDFAAWSMTLVTESDMARTIARHPHMPDIHPYRPAELVAVMGLVLGTPSG